MSRDLLTFYVDMKLSNETDLDKIVERYRVANNPDVYYGGEGEVEIKPSLYIHSSFRMQPPILTNPILQTIFI